MAEEHERPEIDSPEALEAWLKDKPAEWAQVIAVRAALRVFPLVFGIDYGARVPGSRENDNFILDVFRLNFVSLCRHRYSTEDFSVPGTVRDDDFPLTTPFNSARDTAAIGARQAATSAMRSVFFADASAAAAAAAAAADQAAQAARAAAAYESSRRAAAGESSSHSGRAAIYIAWQGVSEDCRWLLEHGVDGRLVDQPLWLVSVRSNPREQINLPSWARGPWDRFLKNRKAKTGLWRLVVDWYRAILPNSRDAQPRSLFDEAVDIDIAIQSDEFWTVTEDRSAEDVFRDIEHIRDGKPTAFQATAASDKNDTVSGPAGGEALADGDVLRTDAVPTHLDEPTTDDRLGRRAFAQALVDRIRKMRQGSESGGLRKSGEGDGFAVHLHAPWGGGKTSILLMMQELLRKPEEGGTPWAVVQFNAWEHEHRKPPWWPLIQALKDGCHADLDRNSMWLAAEDVKCAWNVWILGAELVPYLILLPIVFFFGFLFYFIGMELEYILPSLASITAVFSAGILTARWIFFGSMENFKFYSDLSRDPMARINELFRKLAGTAELPICIFIDDLDRCSADYVVDLLEGIQSSMRHPNVTYVVAADRAWLRSSFEQRYSNFSGHVGNAGQPLGYLFLEKIFQVSTPLPGMGGVKQNYWEGLLIDTFASRADRSSEEAEDENIDRQKKSSEVRAADFDEDVREKRNALRKEFRRNIVEDDVSERLKATTSATERAAIVLELTASPAQYRKIEHLLSSYADRLPDNPRVMKRMINTYAMRRAIGYLEGNPVDYKVLARWTILEQRFPALADLLIEHPGWADMLVKKSMKVINLPQALQPFAGNKDVVKVLGGPKDEHALREKVIATITKGSAS